MTKEEYQEAVRKREEDFKDNPGRYLSWDDALAGILPDPDLEEINRHLAREAIAHLKLRKDGYAPAMKRRLAQIRAEEAELRHTTRAQECFGGSPQNARQAVQMYTAHNKVSVRFDGTCYVAGKEETASKIEGAVILTAEANGLTIGEGKVMSVKGLNLAWAEWLDDAREARKQAVWDSIAQTDRATARKALAQLRALCERLFVEPEFSFWAIVKWIWQVKRRMQGLYVRDLHMLVFRGPQGSGKTEFARLLIKPVQEIAVETSLKQIVDTRNFMLRSHYVGFPDELARAEREDLNEIKTVITGESSTSRVLYSHTSQRNPVNLNLIGTADKPLNEMISDQAGMRRFVECIMLPRDSRDLDWEKDVVKVIGTPLWQAVDYTTSDPLMTRFEDVLLAKQELLRRKSNVEEWLAQWEYEPGQNGPLKANHTADFVEFPAKQLYSMSFRAYEQRYHPGSPETSLTSWGNKFKALIEDGKQPRWSYRKASHNVLYRFTLNAQEQPRAAGNGITLADAVAQRAKLREIIFSGDND
jgi:hypothetical protein